MTPTRSMPVEARLVPIGRTRVFRQYLARATAEAAEIPSDVM
jgi:hypothetical protein